MNAAVMALIVICVITGFGAAAYVLWNTYRAGDDSHYQCLRVGVSRVDGAVWGASRLTTHTVSLERNGVVWVPECGPQTLVAMTTHHKILWH